MRTWKTTVTAIATTLVLSACAGNPQIRVNWFELDSAARTACEQLVTDLPASLGDAARWELSADQWDTEHLERVSAAWGDPIIVLKCGLKSAPETPNTLSTVAGIDWSAFKVVSGYRYTSLNLDQRIAVTIPEVYDATAILSELAPYLSAN